MSRQISILDRFQKMKKKIILKNKIRPSPKGYLSQRCKKKEENSNNLCVLSQQGKKT